MREPLGQAYARLVSQWHTVPTSTWVREALPLAYAHLAVGWEELAREFALNHSGERGSLRNLKRHYDPHAYSSHQAIFAVPAQDWIWDTKERNWRPKQRVPGKRAVLEPITKEQWGLRIDDRPVLYGKLPYLLNFVGACILSGSVTRFRVLEPAPAVPSGMRISRQARERDRAARERDQQKPEPPSETQ